MFRRIILPLILLLTGLQIAFAQTTDAEKPKTVTDDLRKQAVQFLRETGSEVGTLRSLENRISLSSELAGLMWFSDEKEAATMYLTVINDFKQLLAEYDSQMTALGAVPADVGSGVDESEKSRVMRKFIKALGVRQQIALSLAEHDPTLAYNFYYDTLSLVSNAEFREQIDQRDSYFEIQLMKLIAAKEPAKAADFGRRTLAKGVNWSHLELLRTIYAKDADKGAEFGVEIVKKLRADKLTSETAYTIVSVLQEGAAGLETAKKSGKRPMFAEADLRDLSETLAQFVLAQEAGSIDGVSFIGSIERFSPSRAAQIRTKFAIKTKAAATTVNNETVTSAPSIEAVAPPVDGKVPVDTRKEQADTMEKLQKLSSKELPKEERDKIVADARKIIAGLGNKQEKIMALSMIASQVAAAGDKELAAEIMRDAERLVNPAPKSYRDFMEIWFLASGYAQADPEKAFPILDDALFRLNDTLTAFIKVGEFMDESGEMIEDGEVQLGALGGSMVNGLTRELGIANGPIRALAIADFDKTKALANRFDRTEVRILAKLLILRAVLGDEAAKNQATS
ncbi:MAG: hypothetical protein JSS81_15375 [Acidobacteria bacterium]|nr:hypothetical protein [Acidobacteriota bacterium]